jgi:hypothetical protein
MTKPGIQVSANFGQCMMFFKKSWASITKLTPKATSRQLMNPFGDSMLGYGDDKSIVAYLEAINEELPNLLMMA